MEVKNMSYTLEEAYMILSFEKRIDKEIMDEELERILWPNIVTVEELEGLPDMEIWDRFSGLIDIKKFEKIMFWINAFRQTDMMYYTSHIKNIDKIFPADYIVRDLVKRGEFEKLKSMGVSEAEIKANEFSWKYPFADENVRNVPIHNLKLGPHIIVSLPKRTFKTVGDLIDKKDKLKSTAKLGDTSIEVINKAVQEFIDYYQVLNSSSEKYQNKVSLDKDVILDVICDGKDRRYLRAYLKSLGLMASTVSTIVNYKFPRKKDKIEIMEYISLFKEK